MSKTSSKQIEGIILVTIVLALTIWYTYQAFRPHTGAAAALDATSINGLNNPALQQAAGIASGDQNRYGVPVPAPTADQVGKDQLF